MNKEKEIEFSKVLDLVYCAVDFDYFDDYKFIDIGTMKCPYGNNKKLFYFYGYSLMTSRLWFYNDIYIEDKKLSINKAFAERWKQHSCKKKFLQICSLNRLIEIRDKKLKIINIPNTKEEK